MTETTTKSTETTTTTENTSTKTTRTTSRSSTRSPLVAPPSLPVRAPRVANSSAGTVRLYHRKAKSRELTSPTVDEDQLLLLYADYVTTQMGQPISWNEIAAEFEPRDPASGRLAMTGEAIKQHLAKLRTHRETQGFRVPLKLDRNARRNAASIHAARMAASFQTPTSTQKKKAGSSGPKPSTLLASVSKTKQKKAEKAKKAAVGVVKSTSAKRGRKTTIESLGGKGREDLNTKAKSTGLEGLVSIDRASKREDLVSIGGASQKKDLASIDRNVKSEVQSDDDDDLPLSKKSKAKNVGSSLMADTLAIWEGRKHARSPVVSSPPRYGVANSPVVASPPRYGDMSSFALPGIVPIQNGNVDWSYSSSGDNSMGSDYPAGNNFFDPFGTIAPQAFSGFAGLPAFPIQTSGYGYPDLSQNMGMMPLGRSISMPQAYNSFSDQTMTDPSSSFTNSSFSYTAPSSSFMDSSVTDSGQVPMDHSQFLNEQFDDEVDFEAPQDHLTDVFGTAYCNN